MYPASPIDSEQNTNLSITRFVLSLQTFLFRSVYEYENLLKKINVRTHKIIQSIILEMEALPCKKWICGGEQ